MGKCLKGKSEARPEPGAFSCKKCGAVTEKKSHACKPEKIKKKEEKNKKKKKEKERD